jgi:hypothetical protein
MTCAVLSALRAIAVAAIAASSIAVSAPVSAADAVGGDYPPAAAYREYCGMADYRDRYPVFCSSFYRADPCIEDYACDEHSYPMTYDSYRGYTYQAPFGDPYRGGTAYCNAPTYSHVCVRRWQY